MSNSEDQSEIIDEVAAWAARQIAQRLEALRRAGVDRVPLAWQPMAGASPRRRAASAASESGAPKPKPSQEAAVPKPAPPTQPAPRPLFADTTVIEGPILAPDERVAALAALKCEVDVCVKCAQLAETRTQTVFGEGSPTARLMFIGEAPGADEDASGRPFVGRAGQLLTDIITKGMNLKRENVYIANMLKSRPPGNRDPAPEEVANCRPYLDRQIAIIRPEFICLLGRISAQTLLETALPLGKLRGKFWPLRGARAIVTYHPAYLLRNPAAKKDTWEDIQILMNAMGLPIQRGGGEAGGRL